MIDTYRIYDKFIIDMGYSGVGLLAFTIQLIIDYDVLRPVSERKIIPAHKEYRRFLIVLFLYYLLDASWGYIYDKRIMPLAYLSTTLFFASVALSVFLWTRYVIAYLGPEKLFCRLLYIFGWLFLATEAVILTANYFYPLVFYFDSTTEYVPCHMRYTMLMVQVFLFFVTALYTLYVAFGAEGRKRHRHMTIGVSGLALTILIAAQTKYPLLPLYSVGCILSVCIIHRFVVEGEKDDYRKGLEALLDKEKKHRKELGAAKDMINTDPLTGVKSKYAYMETEVNIDEMIGRDEITDLALIIFDLNSLKTINDNYGHEQGDQMICNACKIICRSFAHSPVFRIGGDEFIAVLEGEDYNNRSSILASFDQEVESNIATGGPVVAAGMEDFDPDRDYNLSSVFERADRKMYERKEQLKNIAQKRG